MNISAIILAAGQSSRMKSTTSKLLHKIANKPIINFVIDAIKLAAIDRIIAVVQPEDQQIKPFLANLDSNIGFAYQQEKGTAGATKAAISKIDAEFCLIICADTPLITSNSLMQLIAKTNYDLALLAFEADPSAHYGRLILKNHKLIEIIEFNEATKEQQNFTLCNSGIMLVRTSLLKKYLPHINNHNSKGEYYLTDIINILAKSGANLTHMVVKEEEVMGVNNRVELAKAEELMQAKLRYQLQEKGVTFTDAKSVFLSHDTIIEQDSIIHPFVVMHEKVVVGKHVEIRSFSHLAGVEIKDHAIIGPFARIRPNSFIAEEVHIGNFVEIKNSSINKNTKINHLSYIGDANVGIKCNIGAGAITCNYDGKAKHRTIIKDHVFVGSNTSLIAPIVLNEGSIIAAGSVVNKEVPPQTLAISRAELVMKKMMK
jgi:bifunctional UDP-N-acetylglucosamine pyrophosphorylase / glucosamine-1-phosphate N-acetyltransferase